MTIEYTLTDGVFEVGNLDELKTKVEENLARLAVSAEVVISQDRVLVSYPDDVDIDADEDERIVVGFCQAARFEKAEKVVKELIARRPWDGNARRLHAQILMMQGKVDSAILSCFDSLCLCPKSEYALVLMGNLLARDKNRHEDALRYYKLALNVNPDSAMTLTNCAALMLDAKDGDINEIERLLRRSLELDASLLTTYHALVHVCILKEQPREAFVVAQEGLRKGVGRNENREPIRNMLLKTVMTLAPTLTVKGISPQLLDMMKAHGEKYGVPIKIEARDGLDVPLRLERAENHGRDFHIVAYDPAKAGNSLNHMVCLTILKEEMHQQAKACGTEKRMVSTDDHYRCFLERTKPLIGQEFRKLAGGQEDSMLRFIHHGLVEQLANCVHDLLAERRIYERLPDLRPAQLLGAVELGKGIVQSGQVCKSGTMPKNVVRLTRVMGLFTLTGYREIVGIEMRGDLSAPPDECRLAAELYGEFERMAANCQPGDEWRLTALIAQKLGMDCFCEQVPDDGRVELAAEAKKAVSKLAEREEAEVDASNEGFLSNLRDNPGIGMSVMFFMMDAIKELRAMSTEKVRRVAFQIATMGISGISPGKKSGYSIQSLPGKDMSGCQALAWYYASWRIAFPEKVSGLEQSMPFGEQYDAAVKMLDARGGK